MRELQLVADSADSLKRNRGRRGLDILQRLQKVANLQIQIVEDDFPAVREVDMKLIELAKVYEGKIITNDFNLNKVAQLQGVEVLNINELANSLKPIVLPGETMRVFILKEGKEYNQGVAYLDDGTMVVVDNARKMIGKTIDVSVTSVLADDRRKNDLRQVGRARRLLAAICTHARGCPARAGSRTGPHSGHRPKYSGDQAGHIVSTLRQIQAIKSGWLTSCRRSASHGARFAAESTARFSPEAHLSWFRYKRIPSSARACRRPW